MIRFYLTLAVDTALLFGAVATIAAITLFWW